VAQYGNVRVHKKGVSVKKARTPNLSRDVRPLKKDWPPAKDRLAWIKAVYGSVYIQEKGMFTSVRLQEKDNLEPSGRRAE
jgi:hypothetical protein